MIEAGRHSPARIPDQAIDEVVASCFKTAQGVAGFVGNKGKYGAWRANFVDQIEGAVVCIGSLLKGEKHFAGTPLYKILVKHVVCK